MYCNCPLNMSPLLNVFTADTTFEYITLIYLGIMFIIVCRLIHGKYKRFNGFISCHS